MKTKLITLTICTLAAVTTAIAQPSMQPDLLYSNRFSLLFGLQQPLVLGGGNVEVNYFTKRMSFDYSHGFSLDLPVAGAFKDNRLALHLPYTTGFGIGYRFTSFFDVRFEPKLHSWEVYADNAEQSLANRVAAFRTITLGIGAYYRYMPFKNSTSPVLQGITTSSSIRWWQNVSSSQANDTFSYTNKATGRTEQLDVPNIGIANTPLIVNIAVGYTFGGK
ncbi:hypothetical protein J2I47_11215 [Fibrella sp. HMF5335]|uniref:Outer membrane protein beta-barrel domain-containing protein n=1 Tax=Fibrella rubiginis TaxID=2817060 RepID=A0A939GHZ2_9BACT|nr:hypothetical protein [Fibrella rubiginis]MBO0937116.1 hypothetical protein [Fibrella rubiginis]